MGARGGQVVFRLAQQAEMIEAAETSGAEDLLVLSAELQRGLVCPPGAGDIPEHEMDVSERVMKIGRLYPSVSHRLMFGEERLGLLRLVGIHISVRRRYDQVRQHVGRDRADSSRCGDSTEMDRIQGPLERRACVPMLAEGGVGLPELIPVILVVRMRFEGGLQEPLVAVRLMLRR